MALFPKSPYLTAHIKTNYETGCIGRFSEKNRDVSRTIPTAKMELFLELVTNFQLLTYFTKNLSIRAMGVLNEPLEYCNVF